MNVNLVIVAGAGSGIGEGIAQITRYYGYIIGDKSAEGHDTSSSLKWEIPIII